MRRKGFQVREGGAALATEDDLEIDLDALPSFRTDVGVTF